MAVREAAFQLYPEGIPTPAWQWLVPFVAATAIFSIGAALAIGTDNPMGWLVYTYVGYRILHQIAATVAPGAGAALEIAYDGRYGLTTLLNGTVPHDLESVHVAGQLIPLWRSEPDFEA